MVINIVAQSHRVPLQVILIRWRQPCGKVAEKRRSGNQIQAFDLPAPLPDFQNHFHYVINMALRVNSPWNGQPHQVHARRLIKHERTNLHRANAAFKVELVCQRHSGKLRLWDMRQKCAGINIDRVPARRLDDRYALLRNLPSQVSSGSDAVAQIVFV